MSDWHGVTLGGSPSRVTSLAIELLGPQPTPSVRRGFVAIAGREVITLDGSIPPELGNLENLEYLDLMSLGLTGAIPPELGNLENLESLYLLLTELPGCESFNLADGTVHC